MEQIIQLAPDDDIVSIRSRLEWADARRILMLVPRQNKTLHSLVNLKILARTASALNIKVALVTQSLKVKDLAKEANVKIYATEWMARKAGFISQVAKKVEKEKTSPPQIRLVQIPSPPRIRIKNKKLVVVVGSGRVNFWEQMIALILTTVLALALVVMILALAPAATITLTPQVDTVSTQILLTANPDPSITDVDSENRIIPAEPVQVELTLFAEVETISTEAAPVDFSRGTVIIINRTQEEHFIPMNTVVRTSAGVAIEFATTISTTVPAGTGQTVAVSVKALEPGPRGNVATGQINRFASPTFGLLLRVINEGPTIGGAVRQAGVVTNDDKDRVRSKLRQLIQEEGYQQMLAELDVQEFIPPESLQVIELSLTFNQFAGDVSDTLGAEMQAVVRGTKINNFHANQLAYYTLIEQVPPGKTLLADGLQFRAGTIEDINDRSVSFQVIADGFLVTDIDKEAVRNAIIFEPIGDAQVWLANNLSLVTVPGVEVSPNWLGRLPVFPFRITVDVVDVNALLFDSEVNEVDEVGYIGHKE